MRIRRRHSVLFHRAPTPSAPTAGTCPTPPDRQWFRRRLLAWYRRHGRDLPWRETRDPYRILVSEVMLQQTQVDRVLPKYHEWLDRYPTLDGAGRGARGRRRQDLVSARLQHPAAAAAGDRARSGRATAASCRATRTTLRSFKGIGAYTAGAVMSFAFGKRAAILDTNVARVLFRIFVGRGDRAAHAMEKHLWEISRAVLPHRHVFDFNQALMDFGATLCTARKPQCMICPMIVAGAAPTRSIPSMSAERAPRSSSWPRSSSATGASWSRAGSTDTHLAGCGSSPAASASRRDATACLARELLEELGVDGARRRRDLVDRTRLSRTHGAAALPPLPRSTASRGRCSARRSAGSRATSLDNCSFRKRTGS